MSKITSAQTTAIAPLAEPYPTLDLASITSPSDLIHAFNFFKLNGSDIMDINKAPQFPQTPQLADPVASTPTQASMDEETLKLHVEKLVGDMSAMDISKPTRRPALRQAPEAHPYKRPALTKTGRILSSHGMARKGTPVVPDKISLGRIKSIGSKACVKMNNATISLLSNSPPSPDTFHSAFPWSNAWLFSRSAHSSSSPTTEDQVHATPPSNGCSGDLYMTDKVTVATVVKNREPAKHVGKVKKVRVAKGDPYSKEKGQRKRKAPMAEHVLSKLDLEMFELEEMMSHCQLIKGSNGNAHLTRSKVQAARKAAASCHDSGYEGGHED